MTTMVVRNEHAHRAGSWLRRQKQVCDKHIAAVRRKRSWRPSEQAMAIASIMEDQRTIDYILSILPDDKTGA